MSTGNANGNQPPSKVQYDFVIAANRLPVDRTVNEQGEQVWRRSPGGLVTAMESVMRGRDGAWVGWAGDPGEAPDPFVEDGLFIKPVSLSAEEVADYYEGFSNDTLWPIYHDVIVPATFKRRWWDCYQKINRRFAEAISDVSAEGATVWVHDYQLQLTPSYLRELRPDVRIGWFNHIPFPPVELFAQLPWRTQIVQGLLGADFLGFQRPADANNFLDACRRLVHLTTSRKDCVSYTPPGGKKRMVRAAALPISVDFKSLDALAKTPEVAARAAEIRDSMGNPKVLMLGTDRLDYTKGIRHRLKAYEELLKDGALTPPDVALIQVAVPSRERVEAYRQLRGQIEGTVGQINGLYSNVGATAVQYLHQSFSHEEMAAMFLAADVCLVTPLRDGMNLVAKEYVTCRYDLGGALVLSEFTGAARELNQAFLCNPHDIQGLKNTILAAVNASATEKKRRMRALRKRVRDNDVQHWAQQFLDALMVAPKRPDDA